VSELGRIAAAEAAARLVEPGMRLGLGTGRTMEAVLRALARRVRDEGLAFAGVPTSEATSARARALGLLIAAADAPCDLAIDGADQIERGTLRLIKGGGGALTREKIVASLAKQFICICDDSKQVATLGRFPLPLEVIPLAEASVSRAMQALGGSPRLRLMAGTSDPFVTDNGGWIIDVAGLTISDPIVLESEINQIPGVITVGLFARQKANVLFVGGASGVKRVDFS
jgi:ribose 5-phosphate isomerase A